MPTIANVIPFPPQPAPAIPSGSAAIAAAILAAGRGPEQIPLLVGDFERAAEVSWEVATAMASLEGFTSAEEYLSWTGCAAILAASVTP